MEEIQAVLADNFRAGTDEEFQAALRHPCPTNDNRPCGIAKPEEVVIGADGYLYPCPLWRFHGFNLRKVPFGEAYRRRAELIPEVIDKRWGDLERCAECDAGGHYHHCFATAMRVTGNPLAHIHANHRVAQATARAAAQVQAERQAAVAVPT